MLSLRRGVPVAEIISSNSKTKPKTIHVNDADDDDNDIDSNIKDEILPKSFYTSLKNVNPSNMLLLKRAIRLGERAVVGNNANLQEAFDRADVMLQELLRKYLEIPKKEGHIQVIPQQESSRIAVMGPSGAGKSVWISNFLKQYKTKYPKNEIYIFSPLKDDPAFKDLKIKYVKIDESILEDPLEVSEFENACLVFDDIESIRDKQLFDCIQHFRDCVLETGRHFNETCICVSHIVLNGPATKRILNECDTVLFPKTNFSAISNLCRRYYGMEKDALDYIKNVKSRYVYIKRNYPTAIISEHAVKIL